MASLNRVELIGHIGQDPQLKQTTANSVPVVNLRIATNEAWTDQQGQRQERTTWHTVVCFKRLAEVVAQYMSKGRQVYVEGRLQTREYMGKATNEQGQPIAYGDGQPVMVKKYATEIVATNVQFLGKNPNSTAYPQANQAVPQAGNQGMFIPPNAPPVNNPVNAATAGMMAGAHPANVQNTFAAPQPQQPQSGGVVPAEQLFANTQVPPGV